MLKLRVFISSLKKLIFFSIALQTCVLHIWHNLNLFNLFAASPTDLEWINRMDSLTEEHLRVTRKLESLKFAVEHWNVNDETREIVIFIRAYILTLVDFLILVARSFDPLCSYNTGAYLEYTSYTTSLFCFFWFCYIYTTKDNKVEIVERGARASLLFFIIIDLGFLIGVWFSFIFSMRAFWDPSMSVVSNLTINTKVLMVLYDFTRRLAVLSIVEFFIFSVLVSSFFDSLYKVYKKIEKDDYGTLDIYIFCLFTAEFYLFFAYISIIVLLLINSLC